MAATGLLAASRSTSVVPLIVLAFIALLKCTLTVVVVPTFVLPLVGETETMESGAIVVNEDVFAEDNWLQFFNNFHYTTREHRVREELTIESGGQFQDLDTIQEHKITIRSSDKDPRDPASRER